MHVSIKRGEGTTYEVSLPSFFCDEDDIETLFMFFVRVDHDLALELKNTLENFKADNYSGPDEIDYDSVSSSESHELAYRDSRKVK